MSVNPAIDIQNECDWNTANQQHLMACVDRIRTLLTNHHENHLSTADITNDGKEDPSALEYQPANTLPAPSALDILCGMFNLSPFERDIVLLCAGIELDSTFSALCARSHDHPEKTFPTFSLALAALPEAHWSALTPAAPLRRWRMIEIENANGLTNAPLRIDERILHFLTGIQDIDEQLLGFIQPLLPASDLPPSHEAIAEQIIATWIRFNGEATLPAMQLSGIEISEQRAIAAWACKKMGLVLYSLPAHLIPAAPRDLELFTRLWEREAVLGANALLIECDQVEKPDAGNESALNRFIDTDGGPMIIASHERRQTRQRRVVTFTVDRPSHSEQRTLWKRHLGSHAAKIEGHEESLITQFNLSSEEIQSVCSAVLNQQQDDENQLQITSGEFIKQLWEQSRTIVRPKLEDLATPFEVRASAKDLILPDHQQQIMKEIVAHVRQRNKVYRQWGFDKKSSRGLGISALFSGTSGTGKTMAAEALANELQLDLYQIDLSQIVSKYIGETEKNLKRVFDAAEAGGAILLFDEADALFGKRSDVKDSHDRYANIEVSYLLQRMESYRGLAILTTNMKKAIDTAFLRRIRFIVQFPFPDAAARSKIWRGIFPADTPTKELDTEKLARLNVAGGNIANIALNAAFDAAETNNSVGMQQLLRAARMEYSKLEKTLTDTEIEGWIQ